MSRPASTFKMTPTFSFIETLSEIIAQLSRFIAQLLNFIAQLSRFIT